jgi:hypothetical protein
MALIFIPYRLYGLRDSFRTKYRISEGYAEILKLRLSGWLVVQRLPLEDISTKIEGTASQKLLGWGNIKITTVSGETMLWENLRNTKAAQDALYNWRTIDAPETKGISESKLELAKKTRRTDFGNYPDDSAKYEDTKLETLFGNFICHHDGTFSDMTNRLMWIQAPWGTEWNGKKFKGEPIELNWHDATELFGFGGTIPETTALTKEKIKTYRYKEYKRGSCTVTFSGYSDWRLPTAEELLNLRFFDRKTFGYNHEFDTESKQLYEQFFPDHPYVYPWSANDNGDCGWASDGKETLADISKGVKRTVLFVRRF